MVDGAAHDTESRGRREALLDTPHDAVVGLVVVETLRAPPHEPVTKGGEETSKIRPSMEQAAPITCSSHVPVKRENAGGEGLAAARV
jgi:hypothetical protein